MSPLAAAELDAVADALLAAQRDGGRAPAPTATLAGLDVEAGYAIQRALVERRLAAGESAIGWKIGMASAVGRTAASPGPIYGRLLSGMLVDDGGTLERARLHGPHAEGEIAIVLERPLRGPGVTAGDVLAAAAGVRPGDRGLRDPARRGRAGGGGHGGRQLELRAPRPGRDGSRRSTVSTSGSAAWSSRATTRSRAPARAARSGTPPHRSHGSPTRPARAATSCARGT